jgi:hypothetical protein
LEDYAQMRFKPSHLDIAALFSWRIKRKDKPAILRTLEANGISSRSLFPDLDGLAEGLWRTEVLFHGK